MEIKERKHVRITLTRYYYDLAEGYTINEIFNRVTGASYNAMLELYDAKNEPIYIRASKIEAIEVITEQYVAI